MIKIPYLDKTDSIEVYPESSYLDFNIALVTQVLYCLKWRVTVKPGRAKNRSEVRGGGRKPWKQKGTGRARAGSIRSPLFVGGGVTFGPSGDKSLKKIPQKMKKMALGQLLVKKIKSKEVFIISDLDVKSGKTKEADKKLKDTKSSIVLVVEKGQLDKIIPFRNLAYVEPVLYENINPEDIVSKKHFVFSQQAAEKLKKDLEKKENEAD